MTDKQLVAHFRPRVIAAEKLLYETRIKCESALAKLDVAGSGAVHDPSWIRPKGVSVKEIRESCIQAYHVLHDAIEGLALYELEQDRGLAESIAKACADGTIGEC